MVGCRLYLLTWGVISVSVDLEGETFICLNEATVLVCYCSLGVEWQQCVGLGVGIRW